MILHNVIGDVTNPQLEEGIKIIAHCCNDIGVMGAGVALAIANKWPKVKEEYIKWSKNEDWFRGGMIQIVPVEKTIFVANMIGQHGVCNSNNSKPIKYDWLFQAMCQLNSWIDNFKQVKFCMGSQFESLKVTIHLPLIGAGLAGGNFKIIEELIKCSFAQQEVFIYRLVA